MALFPLLPFLSRSQRGNCKHPWNRNSNCRRDGSCKESSFFFLQDIYYMSFLTTQSHTYFWCKNFFLYLLLITKIYVLAHQNSRSGSGKKGYHFCWDEFSKLLEKRNPPTKSHASPTTIGIKKPSSDWRLQRSLALNLHQISSRMPFDDLSWQGFSTYFYYGYTLVY